MINIKHPYSSQDSLRGRAMAIINILYGGSDSTERSISVRQVESEIKDEVNRLQWEEDRKRQRELLPLEQYRKTTFKCIALEDTEDFTCRCSGQGWSLKKARIPKMVEWNGSPYVEFVGTISESGRVPFVLSSASNIDFTAGVTSMPSYFIQSDSVYVALPPQYSMICEVTVIGAPKDVFSTSGKCFDVWSSELNIPDHIYSVAKRRVMDYFGRAVLSTKNNLDIVENNQEGNNINTVR